MFNVEIDAFTPDARRIRNSGLSADDTFRLVQEAALGATAFVLASNTDKRNTGDFLLWLSGDRAQIRLDLHREWYAIAPEDAGSLCAEVTFQDGDGSSFVASHRSTVSRTTALEALLCWLRTGTMAPQLRWE